MKTTLDLPAGLVREMKLRAVHEGRKLKDIAAELLERGLALPTTPAGKGQKAPIKLPLFPTSKAAPALKKTTKQLLALEQELQTREDLQRLGLSL